MDIISRISAAATLLWIDAASAAECIRDPAMRELDGKLAARAEGISINVGIGSFAIGTLLIAAGLMKLKQAEETKGKEVKYGDGLWRLFVGAGLTFPLMLAGTRLFLYETFPVIDDLTLRTNGF